MKTYTITYWQDHWEELIDLVENGEDICVTNGKEKAIIQDDLIRIHSEHDEAS